MRKFRFSETQIVKMLKEGEAGRPVAEICREQGISATTFYKWKTKYRGMEASDMRRLKDLEAEHSRLKQMFAELSLENQAFEGCDRKKVVKPADKRELVTYAHVEHVLNLRRACRAFSRSRSMYGYQPEGADDELVIEALVRLAEQFPRFAFGKLFPLMRREQLMWNYKRVHRVYRTLKLYLRRKGSSLREIPRN